MVISAGQLECVAATGAGKCGRNGTLESVAVNTETAEVGNNGRVTAGLRGDSGAIPGILSYMLFDSIDYLGGEAKRWRAMNGKARGSRLP